MALFWGCTLLGQVYAMPTENACATITEGLNTAAQQHHLKSIAILPFLANGKMSNAISEELRDLVLEKLSDYPALDVFDRKEMRLVATESSISCPESTADTASSFLVAEIFYAQGDPVGYLSYRLIQTSDSRVLAAGFLKLDWDEAQRGLFSGADRTLKSGQLPLIPDDEAKTMAAKTESIQDNIAVVYDGSDSKDNTLAARMAFAQTQTWLVQNGHAVFEREFLRDAATEKSLNDDVANSGDNITTVAHIKMKKKDDSSNRVTLQFFALANHKNQATFSLIQNVTSEAVGNMQGDDGENALAQRMKNRRQAQNELAADIEFVHHFEYVFTDAQRKILEQRIDAALDQVQRMHPNWDENDQLVCVKHIIYLQLWDNDFRMTVGRALAKKFKLDEDRGVSISFFGAIRDERWRKPEEFKKELERFSGEEEQYAFESPRPPYAHFNGHAIIKRSVDWKNGVPCKITADIDFSKDADALKKFFGQIRSSTH